MATAGRILIIPKGPYDASTTYEMLDMVSHNGATWLAKKTSVGIAPSDSTSDYWFKMVGISLSELESYRNEIMASVTEAINESEENTNTKFSNVDNKFANYVPLAGGNMNGALKAVNPAANVEGVRNITAGTSDLTAGSSPLANGSIHVVYE